MGNSTKRSKRFEPPILKKNKKLEAYKYYMVGGGVVVL